MIVMTRKRTYCAPSVTRIFMDLQASILTISAGTSDPTEGGDPTGGNGSTPNPFSSSSNTRQQIWSD